MNPSLIVQDGDRYLRIDAVAEIFDVQVTWIEAAFENGLLDCRVFEETTPCIRVTELDRIAQLIRLSLVYELDWDNVALHLDD